MYSVFVMLIFDDFKSALLLHCFSSKKSIITWRSWPTTTSATTSARVTTASSTTWRSWTCRSTGRDGAWPRPRWTLTTRRRRTRCQFYEHFMSSFCLQIFQKGKKTLMTWLSFCAFGICTQKKLLVNMLIGEINPRSFSRPEFFKVLSSTLIILEGKQPQSPLPDFDLRKDLKNKSFAPRHWQCITTWTISTLKILTIIVKGTIKILRVTFWHLSDIHPSPCDKRFFQN